MSFTDQLKFIEGGIELLNRIEPLWEQSKALHTEKSTHFSEFFANTKFSARKEVFEHKAIRGKLLSARLAMNALALVSERWGKSIRCLSWQTIESTELAGPW